MKAARLLIASALRRTSVRAVLLAGLWFGMVHLLALAASRLPLAVESPWAGGQSVAALARFDAGWYGSIAENGYSLGPAGGQANVAFFPLYPMLAQGLALLLGVPFFTGGFVLSFVALLTACGVMAAEEPEWAGLGAVAALLCWPSSFFLASIYTEALFLALAVVTSSCVRRGRFGWAAAGGFLAALTRPNGVLVALLVLPRTISEVRQRGRRAAPAVAALVAPIAGLGAFLAFFAWRFGSPFVGFRAYAAWGRLPGHSGEGISRRFTDVSGRVLGLQTGYGLLEALELGSLVLFVVLTVALFRKGRYAEALFSAAVLAMAGLSGSLVSMHRYVLVLFPCFGVLGEVLARSRVALTAYVIVGTGLGVTLLTRFVLWVFVG